MPSKGMEISIDDLEAAEVVVMGSLLWEFELPDGRCWLRLEITDEVVH